MKINDELAQLTQVRIPAGKKQKFWRSRFTSRLGSNAASSVKHLKNFRQDQIRRQRQKMILNSHPEQKKRSPPLCRSKKKSKSDPSVVGRWSKFSFLPTVRQLSIALHLASMIWLVDWKLPDSRRLLNRIDLRSNNKRKPKSRPKGDDEFMDSQSNIIAISSWKKNTKRIKRQGGKREKKKKREFVK